MSERSDEDEDEAADAGQDDVDHQMSDASRGVTGDVQQTSSATRDDVHEKIKDMLNVAHVSRIPRIHHIWNVLPLNTAVFSL